MYARVCTYVHIRTYIQAVDNVSRLFNINIDRRSLVANNFLPLFVHYCEI